MNEWNPLEASRLQFAFFLKFCRKEGKEWKMKEINERRSIIVIRHLIIPGT